ncbi:transposase [Parafrankia discariae]|uniref:transposase n=1 Tax=Parafrankia discariae TaxID=365528 RepID=UPI000A022D17
MAPRAPGRPRRFRYPGRRPVEDRAASNGIRWMLRDDVPWRESPTGLFGVSG